MVFPGLPTLGAFDALAAGLFLFSLWSAILIWFLSFLFGLVLNPFLAFLGD